METNEPYDVITATLPSEEGAARALEVLERAEEAGLLDIENAAVIVKDESGEIEFEETEGRSGWQGFAKGLMMGGLLGLLLPGRSIAPSALKSATSGAFTARLRDTGSEDDDIRAVAEAMEAGTSMVVAIVQYKNTEKLAELLQSAGGARPCHAVGRGSGGAARGVREERPGRGCQMTSDVHWHARGSFTRMLHGRGTIAAAKRLGTARQPNLACQLESLTLAELVRLSSIVRASLIRSSKAVA